MTPGFRIQKVDIEGFKGFTTKQEINFQERHAFLLGENGNGKSSIIEAIRWGLFGSTRRPNEVIENRGYSGDCCILITLTQGGKQWKLRRRLIRGAGGGSGATLTDESGAERLIREIMPQLDSLDAGEGTYIIFAPQATPLRRQPEDLNPFERTVFTHLGLSQPRGLLSQLDNFLEEQHNLEDNLGKQLTEARGEIDDEVDTLGKRRTGILSSMSHDREHGPSAADSENKARDFIMEITQTSLDDSLWGLSLTALLGIADEALNNARRQADLSRSREDLIGQTKRFQELVKLQQEIRNRQDARNDLQSKLDALLDGTSIDELHNRVATTRSMQRTGLWKQQILNHILSFAQHAEETSMRCPVCNTEHHRTLFENALKVSATQISDDETSQLNQSVYELEQAKNLQTRLQDLEKQIANFLANAGEFIPQVYRADDEQLTLTRLSQIIESSELQVKSIEKQISDHQDWYDSLQVRLSKLRTEEQYHTIGNRLVELRRSKLEFAPVEEVYNDLVSLGESVRTIRQAVDGCLKDRLEKAIPPLSEQMSQIFAALTQHSYYDQVTIARDLLPKLQLRVGSSQDPSRHEHPVAVLNGQAESALALVPYFVFSQQADAPTEVYLVLLDDPTRAFDEAHIEILVERLADLGKHVQVMVASQESARFRNLLPQKFPSDSYVIVEPRNWTYPDGPELHVEYR